MIMNMILVAVAVVALAVTLVRLESGKKRKMIEEAFSGRERLRSAQFYVRYFKEQGISFHIVDGVRTILEKILVADLSRLTVEDDFSRNLSFFWDFDSMADVEIVLALEGTFGIEISSSEAENARTVHDIVNMVHRKLSAFPDLHPQDHPPGVSMYHSSS